MTLLEVNQNQRMQFVTEDYIMRGGERCWVEDYPNSLL